MVILARCDEKILKVKLFDINNYKAQVLDLEKYVVGAVAFAMPPKFSKEALKAQAICCRTFAIRQMGIFGGTGCNKQPGYDICSDSTHCQGYLDDKNRKKIWKERYKEFNKNIESAVKETEDIIIVYNDKPIKAVCHLACGGSTEDSENVWKNSVSYLRKVECSFCKNSPYWKIHKNFATEELMKRLPISLDENRYCTKNVPDLIEDIQITPSGRINKIKIGDKYFEGEDVRKLLGFPSTRFFWKVSSLSFEVMGQGHGLGMCQYGANGMAKLGYTAEEILRFYFTGVKFKKIQKPTKNKPLTGKTIVIDPGGGGPRDRKGPMGVSEGYLNLEIAKELMRSLEEKGVKVYLTRNENKSVTLSRRVETSNQHRPNFTISIHQNVYSNEKMRGTEIYYYPGDEEGKRLAKHIQKQMVSKLEFKDLGAKCADLYIIRETNHPSVQINVAFLSNPEDERFLTEPKFRRRIAEAITTAIIDYYKDWGYKVR